LDREGFIAIISPVRDLIFIEKIATCYKSSVGAGLAPALWACPSPLGLPQPSGLAPALNEYISYNCSGGRGKPSPYYFCFSSLLDYLAYFTLA